MAIFKINLLHIVSFLTLKENEDGILFFLNFLLLVKIFFFTKIQSKQRKFS